MQNQTPERADVATRTIKIYEIAAVFSAVIFLTIADRLFKALALLETGRIKIAGEWLALAAEKNQGIAFSLPLYGVWLNWLLCLIIIILVVFFLFSTKKLAWWQASFLLAMIVGAGSNLFDRLKYGAVIDYIDLRYFTVFNLADALIVGGVVGLIWLGLYPATQFHELFKKTPR